MLLQASFNYERMQASGWLYGLLPALKKIHTNKRDLARAMKGHMGFFNTHPFLVTFVIGIILAMERSKQDVNSIQSTKIAVGAPLGGIGDAMFWLTLLPICGGIGASLALQGSILGAVVFIVLFNVVHLGLRFGLAHYAYRMGVAAIPLIKANTKKVGHAASIVGMTVIGALVATYVRLNTTLEIKAGDAVVKLQTDVIDKLMPAFLPLVYTLTMFWLVRRGWSPLRLIGITVVLGVVGIILTGHGGFASGLEQAMRQILGEQPQFIAIDFPENSTTARLTAQLEQAVNELDPEQDIIFLTDLLGGTPFRVASTLAMQRPGSEVITGTNLQLLLEMVLERDGLSSEAFRLQALECGHRGLTSLVDELGRCREEAPVEEGI
ncbi:hypothetical protein ID866_701 [Astraeus odoratus]|nr:hypothetical protein ID866_701 [Astraeus odoratus]